MRTIGTGTPSSRNTARTRRRILATLVGGVIAASTLVVAAPSAAPASDVIFTVGTKQDVDSMNPNAGVVLSAYEVWNLQYNVLVNLSAADMSPIPDLATSWERSADGLTWTYHLRSDAKWSDGKPLTAEDAAYTFTRMRDEEWSNFGTFLDGFTKIEAPDATTLVVTSKTPDPRLPNLPVYVLPKHVWEKIPTKSVGSYPNRNPVTSGPFRLTTWNKGSYFELTANKDFYGGAPAVDKVRFQIFRNDEAMAAALRNGDIDALYNLSPDLADTLKGNANVTRIDAQDGSFTQLTMNTGSGPVGNGHPALADVRVRQAIAHAIDKNALVDRVLNGLGTPGQSMNVAVAPKWNLKVPEDKQLKFDIAEANRILDDAGYKKGSNGIRTMPDGSNPLKLRFYYPADDAVYAGAVQFIKEWLQEIGIATTATPKSEDELTPIENQGKFDLIVWSWTPYTDPTAMMSYLTCGQVPAKPDDGRYNDAFFCDPEYDRLFEAQATELDEPTRISLVKQAQQEFYTQAPYVVLYMQDTVEAYRNDRFTGFVRQPAETGPIIYTQSDPSYLLIKPVSGAPTSASTTGDGQQASSSDSGGGSSAAPIIIGVILAVGVIGGVGYGWSRRRKTADERE